MINWSTFYEGKEEGAETKNRLGKRNGGSSGTMALSGDLNTEKDLGLKGACTGETAGGRGRNAWN